MFGRKARNDASAAPAAELAEAGGGVATDATAAAMGRLGWFHSIELAPGQVTPGIKSPEVLRREWQQLALPDLRGRSLLDIGAWDGWFSFEAERAGAARVVALDHYAWAMDHKAQHEYYHQCEQRGVAPQPYDAVPGLLDLDGLPGKANFDAARAARASKVDTVVGDFMRMDLAPVGRFDVVLFLGVLYHLEDPLAALRRVASVTAGLAVIETVSVHVPGHEHHALWEFFESTELDGDPTNWWAGNPKGIQAMCRAAGFREVTLVAASPPNTPPVPGNDYHYGRAVVHALR